MSEPNSPSREPNKDGGLKQPETPEPSSNGLSKTGGGETRGDGDDDGASEGMLGEG